MTHTPHDPDRDPTLGSLDDLDLGGPVRRGRAAPSGPATPPPTPTRQPAPPRRSRGGWWVLLFVAGVVGGFGLWALSHWRESLGEQLVPVSELNQHLQEAEAALARGHLTATDGSGAREKFQAVLARDPDHQAARRGLAAVRDAALAQSRAALEGGDATTARARLELARAMAAPAAELAQLESELQRVESTGADIADRLQRARDAQAAGRLDQVPDGALSLYEDVLRLQPDNALALEGRRTILAGLLARADKALATGDLASAEALVARVVATDPSHLGLPAIQAQLGEATAARAQRRDDALRAAAAAMAAGRFEDAAGGYLALLDADPANAAAREGLDDAAAAVAARASRQAADFDFDAAEASLRLAKAWDPDSPAIVVAEQRIADAQATQGRLPPAAETPKLDRLLRQATLAMRRGELIDPPGDSAWDRLRVAAGIAPDHPDVQAALTEYDRRARACFEDELASNRLSRAQACLDAMIVRDRRDGMARDRHRLADRWLAFAEERLGAGELALARRAIDAAHAVEPAHPGIAAIEERLARASW